MHWGDGKRATYLYEDHAHRLEYNNLLYMWILIMHGWNTTL